MGRAIVRQPAAFLMDEPLSNLDAKLRVQMRADIKRIQSDLGVTTIYVTHDQVEAMTMGHRVAVMRKGELQQVAPPQELYDQPGQRVRRRLHRQPGDEHARGTDRAAERRPRGGAVGETRARARRRDAVPRVRRSRPTRAATVVLGIRPEDLEDAALADGDAAAAAGPGRAARGARLGGARALHDRRAARRSPTTCASSPRTSATTASSASSQPGAADEARRSSAGSARGRVSSKATPSRSRRPAGAALLRPPDGPRDQPRCRHAVSGARRGATLDAGTLFCGAGSSTTTVGRCSSTAAVPTPLI